MTSKFIKENRDISRSRLNFYFFKLFPPFFAFFFFFWEVRESCFLHETKKKKLELYKFVLFLTFSSSFIFFLKKKKNGNLYWIYKDTTGRFNSI